MKTILIGGGGHALSLLETLSDYSNIAGYADLKQSQMMAIPYLGTDEDIINNYSPLEYDIQITLVYTSEVNLKVRRKIIEKYKNYQFHTFIAKSALTTQHSEIGDGCVLMEKAIVNHSIIQKNTIVNTGAIIEHNCKIGNNCFIGPGSVICGGVTIGDNTLIGAGVIIRDDVSIAPDSVIGMGSVVTTSLNKSGIYLGSPIKKFK